MRSFLLSLAAIGVLGTAPACAQEPQAAAAPAAPQPKPPTPQERIAELEAALARQTAIADNAAQSLQAAREEIKLKDELIVLGRERNAELYAIAMEIAQKYVRRRDWEPFVQHDRVRLENAKQSYEDRLGAARIYESTLPPSVQQRMDAELSKRPAPQPQN